MYRAVLLIFAVNVLMAPASGIAQVQPGSTGGSVGKQDKSISGGGSLEVPGPTPREAKPHQTTKTSPGKENSSCGRIVGTWKMGAGIRVVVKRDGTAHHDFAGNGTWKCDDGQYVFVWSNGITDHMSVSADGASIAGTNSVGMTYSGTRF